MMPSLKKLFLIDGSSYIFRAFFAIRGLSTSKGLPTNAIFGFTSMLLKILRDLKPDGVAMVFDTKAPTFRNELFLYSVAGGASPEAPTTADARAMPLP